MIFDLEYMERYHLTAEEYQKEPWQKIWLSELKWGFQDERRRWLEEQQDYSNEAG